MVRLPRICKLSFDLSSYVHALTGFSIPKVTFGIVFDNSAISNAAVNTFLVVTSIEIALLTDHKLDLGVDAYARLAGTSTVGSNQNFKYCYEADAGATLFASVQAP
jgi:chitinase